MVRRSEHLNYQRASRLFNRGSGFDCVHDLGNLANKSDEPYSVKAKVSSAVTTTVGSLSTGRLSKMHTLNERVSLDRIAGSALQALWKFCHTRRNIGTSAECRVRDSGVTAYRFCTAEP